MCHSPINESVISFIFHNPPLFSKVCFLGKQTQDLQQNCIPLGHSSREQQLINLKLGFTSYSSKKRIQLIIYHNNVT